MVSLRRLIVEFTAALAVPAAGAGFVASRLFPEDPGAAGARPLIFLAAALVLVAESLLLAWLLRPVGEGLAPGADEARRRAAVVAALRLPLRVSLAGGALSTLAVAVVVARRLSVGRPAEAALAAASAGMAFAVMGAMLAYSVASNGLADALLVLGPMEDEPLHASMRSKVLAMSAGLVAFALLLVSPIAYARYRADLDRDHLERAERVLTAAAAVGAREGPAAAAEFTFLAAGAPALVVDAGGAVLARAGGNLELPVAPAGPERERASWGWRLRRPLPGGRTLVALLPEAPLAARRVAFWTASGALGAAVLAAATLLVWLVARGLTTSLRSLGQAVDRVAAGDLTAAPPSVSRDEMALLAAGFRRMTQGLTGLVQDVQDASRGVLAGTRQVEEIGARVATGAADDRARVRGVEEAVQAMQASVSLAGRSIAGLSEYVASTGSAVAEMGASFDEVRRQAGEMTALAEASGRDTEQLAEAGQRAQSRLGGIEEIAEHASRSLQAVAASLSGLETSSVSSQLAAAQAAELAEHAGTVVREAADGIEGVRAAVGDAKRRVTALGQRSDDIDKILDFINEVAGRTNLLSLNASIIATQAGEHGKAFAVVAEHIRALASQISSSTKSIGEIIRAVRDDVEGTAQLIDRGDELAAGGVALARKSLGALDEIRVATGRGHETAAAIQGALQVHADSTREVASLVAEVAESSRGMAEAVAMVGRSVAGTGSVARAVAALADRVGRALEQQAGLGRRQMGALERITTMIGDVTRAMERHGAATRSVEEALRHLARTTEEHERSVGALGSVAVRLVRHSQALGERVGKFKIPS